MKKKNYHLIVTSLFYLHQFLPIHTYTYRKRQKSKFLKDLLILCQYTDNTENLKKKEKKKMTN